MATTTFNLNDSAIIASGPHGFASIGGYGTAYDYRNINLKGLRHDFEFDGAQIEIVAQSFGAGTSPAVFIVDGVQQTRLSLTTSTTWYTAWTGTEGTHSCTIYADNGGTTSYMVTPLAGGLRITGASPAVRRLAGYGANLSIFANKTYFLEDARTFENSGTNVQFRLPSEGARFKTVANAPGWTGEIKLYCMGFSDDLRYSFIVDGVPRSTVQSAPGTNGKMGYFIGITVDPTVVHEIDFQLVYDGSSAGFQGASNWGFMFVGAINHPVNTSPAFTAQDIVLFSGDSITQHTSTATPDSSASFASIVSRRFGLGVANHGVSGRNLSTMASSIASQISALRAAPKRIIVMGGRNDLFQATPTATSKSAMASLLSAARSAAPAAEIIWLQMLGSKNPLDAAPDATLQSGLASQFAASVSGGLTNARFISDAHNWIPFTDTYFLDSVHPSAAGNSAYANRLIPVLSTTAYTITGPVSGVYTAALANGATFDGQCTVTLTTNNAATIACAAVGGSIASNNSTAPTVTPANGQTSFLFTPSLNTTITFTNGQSGWANPSNLDAEVDDPSSASSFSSFSSNSSSSSSSLSSNSSSSSSSPSSNSSSSSRSSLSEISSNSSSSTSSASSNSSSSSSSLSSFSSISSGSSNSSSSQSVEIELPFLPAASANLPPTVLVNDDDLGIPKKFDEVCYRYMTVPAIPSPAIIDLSSPYANSEIRYTLNGSIPTSKSRLYTGPLVFHKNVSGDNTVIRARVFDSRNSNSRGRIIRIEFKVME